MMKYTVTAKNNQGAILFTNKIEGKSNALKAFNEQVKDEAVKSVKMTRWVVTTGVTSIEKMYVKEGN